MTESEKDADLDHGHGPVGEPVSDGKAQNRSAAPQSLDEQMRYRDMLQTLMTALPQQVSLKDVKGRYILCNPAFESFHNVAPGALIGKTDADFLPKARADQMRSHDMHGLLSAQAISNEETLALPGSGRTVILETTRVPIRDPDRNLTGLMTLTRDVTESRKLRQTELDREMQQQQHTRRDALTGLLNRQAFFDALARSLTAQPPTGGATPLLLIDIDKMGSLNEQFGMSVGDVILAEVGRRLSRSVGQSGTIGRVGNDKFAVLPGPQVLPSDLEALAQWIKAELAVPFSVNGNQLAVTVSIGVACGPADGASPQALMQAADDALALARDAGSGRIEFYAQINRSIHIGSMGFELEDELRKGLDNNEFVAFFQAKIDLVTQDVTGAEALVRWKHPKRGYIPPSLFLPLAEQTGLILPIGDAVFAQSCAMVCDWNARCGGGKHVSINISAGQLLDPDFSARLTQHIKTAGCETGSIELEISEGLLEAHNMEAREVLTILNAAGIGLAIDDFGSGHLPLTYLTHFPVHTLKIDRAFLKDIVTDESRSDLLRAINAFSSQLNMVLVAEGVESEAEARLASDAGCRFGQGYFWNRPMTRENFEEWLKRRPVPTGPIS